MHIVKWIFRENIFKRDLLIYPEKTIDSRSFRLKEFDCTWV